MQEEVSRLIPAGPKKPLFIPPHRKTRWNVIRAATFLNSFGPAALQPFLAMIYFTFGRSLMQIGILLSIPAFISVFGAQLWCTLSPTYKIERAVHILCLISGTLVMHSLSIYKHFAQEALVIAIAHLQLCATAPLLEKNITRHIQETEEGDFESHRKYGLLGTICGAIASGVVVAQTRNMEDPLNIFLFSQCASLAVLTLLPTESGAPRPPEHSSEAGVKFVWRRFREVTRERQVVLAMLFVVIFSFMNATITCFLSLYLYFETDSPFVVGLLIVVQTLSEGFVQGFVLMPWFDRFGTFTLLFGASFCITFRLAVFASGAATWAIIAVEGLSGFCFSLAWSVCAIYSSSAVSEELEGYAMSMLSIVGNSAGFGVAAIVGGCIWQEAGPRTVWLLTGSLLIPLVWLICKLSSPRYGFFHDHFSHDVSGVGGADRGAFGRRITSRLNSSASLGPFYRISSVDIDDG